MTGRPLPGGFASTVHRVGDTVRRTPPERAGFVHALLDHFERQGWPGAPRYLGTDEHGREILTYVDGHVPWAAGQPALLASAEMLRAVGALVRELHDLTAGSALAGDREVVCHNDLSPKNTVYRDGRPVAFLDWDLAAPGDRLADVAHACWQYPGLVERMLQWQEDCWRGIEEGVAGGDPHFDRLRDARAAESVRAQHQWTASHREALDAALQD